MHLKNLDDPALLKQEPFLTHVVLRRTSGERSLDKCSVARFVEAVQQDAQAAEAAKKWARLMFPRVLANRSFELTDGGQALYRVFFEDQCLLHQAREEVDFTRLNQFRGRVRSSGINFINAVKPEGCRAGANTSTRGRGNDGKGKGRHNPRPARPCGSKKASPQSQTANHIPPTVGRAISSSHSTAVDLPTQENVAVAPPPASARRLTLSERAKSARCSISKKEKKRKASSQKPAVITPSDASEDDKEPRKTSLVTAATSLSHRSKRIASDPFRRPHEPTKVGNRVDKTKPTRKVETSERHHKSATDVSQRQSPLAGSACDGFVSHSSVKGRRSAGFPLNSRKRHRQRSSVSIRPLRPRPDSRQPRKIAPVRDPHPPESKRIRRASMSTLDREVGGSDTVREFQVEFLIVHEPTAQQSLITGSPLTGECVQSNAQRKRTRLEFEAALVASDESASANSQESLGPDIRQLRPLPRKVRKVRLATTVRGVPYRAPSLEHADQLLRDTASNELAILREGFETDVPDWTQDKESDAESDELQDDDQDEVNDNENTTAPSAPTKPPVPAPPHIWAQSRQEVCESFEYFRCYHGGVYFKDDIVKGYLLGAYSANRDIFHHGGKLIISHGGGKSESIYDPRKGPRRYQTDQDQKASDKSVRALLRTFKDRRPIVLLADDKYAHFPYDLTSPNYTYIVLGLYRITHAWAECQSARDGSGCFVRWKFAFQWCEGQGHPWWLPRQEMAGTGTTSHAPKSHSNPKICPAGRSSDEDTSIQCDHCREPTPFVYKQGWMCLNPRCDSFWSINGEEPRELDYREEFLTLLPQRPEKLPNIIPARVAGTSNGVTTTYAFSKGLHCRNCGRLSCRYKWEHWECSNCNIKHVVNGRVRSPKEFWHQRPPRGFLHSQIVKDSGIIAARPEPIDVGGRKGFTSRLTFVLPQGRGNIHLILGTPLSNGDADDIFRMYQQQASTGELKLRRYPLRNHKARGLLLTNYFSQNSGEPYQYVGGSGQTVPFCEAPECVRRALALIKERASLALSADVPFNEILSAAYMERQKMAFHSDSEKGLGPIVASLSLGSAALMHFRPHVGVENPMNKCTYALTLVLRHGDVLIMEGDGVQKYYEHTVIPMNFRIAATARCIGSA